MRKLIRHGEIVLVPIEKFDMTGAKKVKGYVVGHSETGHNHFIEGGCGVLERKGQDTMLTLEEPSILKHKKTHDRHADVEVDKGIWRVLRKKEYDPFAKVLREVMD